MTLRPHIFTFYSYKGGVGRSMALLNVAYTLHSLGRHVLVVDLDLEAPGVSGFLRRNEELPTTEEDKPDVVDLLSDLMPALQWEMGEASRPGLPILEKYLRSVRTDQEKYAPARNPRFLRTRLDVLSASDQRDYSGRLGALNLGKLTGEQLVDAGNLLREVFFSHQFPWRWEEAGEDLLTRYDYILIDSRTGFTETSGLCIGPLADRLVLFCGLNDQNIHGTAEFLKVVGLKPASPNEEWDDGDPEDATQSPSLGQKPTLLIASPVPFGEMEMKATRFAEMKKVLGTAPDASISYHPRLSIIETVFCRDGVAENINQEYQDITMRLLSMVGDHPNQWERRNDPFRKKKTQNLEALRRSASLMDEENLRRMASRYAFMADRLSDQARDETGDEADAIFTNAGKKYQAALALRPDDHEALNHWGNALSDQAEQKTGAEADALFSAAAEKYQAALAIKPDKHAALFNWGNTLYDQAKQKTGAEADALFSAAAEKYQAALAIKPDKHEALNNWGNALSDQAEQKAGAEADALFSAAAEKYQASLAIKPDDHEALNNWGNALSDQAKKKTGAEADALFSAAAEKYQASLAIKPDDHEALNNWGNALSDRAKKKTGAEADALFSAAAEKFQAALAIKPDDHEALNNWGIALSDQAKQKTGAEADALFFAAAEKYQAAHAIMPDKYETLYNLACLSSLKKDVEGSLALLSQARGKGEYLTQAELDDDSDFDPIRTDPAFVAFREALPLGT